MTPLSEDFKEACQTVVEKSGLEPKEWTIAEIFLMRKLVPRECKKLGGKQIKVRAIIWAEDSAT